MMLILSTSGGDSAGLEVGVCPLHCVLLLLLILLSLFSVGIVVLFFLMSLFDGGFHGPPAG